MKNFYAGTAKYLCLLACLGTSLFAQNHEGPWARISEGPFSIYTQGDSSEAASLVHGFAELQAALFQASPFHSDPESKLSIIAFRSEKEFAPYRLNAGSCAFYQQTGHSDYVVLQQLDGPNRDVSFHEFSHFVFAHSNAHLPLWLNEGLADFYSTFGVSDQTVTFGRAVSGRLAILRSNTWLPLDELFRVDTSSSYYSNPQRMTVFYSESWILAHMLILHPDYGPHFGAFLNAINAGESATQAVKLVYAKTPVQLQQDLREYVSLPHLPTAQAALKLPSFTSKSSTTSVSSAEVDVYLADLNLSNPETQAAVQTRLARSAAELPQSALAEESLGYAALRQGRTTEARQHFQAAVNRRSTDATVLYYLAHLDHEAGEPSSKVVPLLEQALALKPDLGDARLELALAATEDGDYSKALANLQKLSAPRPENAYTAAYTEAFCLANLDKLPEARMAARRAQAVAVNDHDRAELAQLAEFIDQQTKDLVASSNEH